MNLKTKCRKCSFYGDCNIQETINKIIQKAIKNTENSVRLELSQDIEYLIVTDITLIPTNCRQFVPKENPVQHVLRPAGGLSAHPLVTT